jgi:hypothetical protein
MGKGRRSRPLTLPYPPRRRGPRTAWLRRMAGPNLDCRLRGELGGEAHITSRHILVKPLSRFGSAFAMELERVGAADLRRDHVRP